VSGPRRQLAEARHASARRDGPGEEVAA